VKSLAGGILLHITSLPSPYGIGDMGPEAYRFVDFLSKAGQSFWQILPVNPSSGLSNSPYQCNSAFAGNPLLISPELLVNEGWVGPDEASSDSDFPAQRVDYGAVYRHRENLLSKAYNRFQKHHDRADYDAFCRAHRHWLDDYVLFMALKSRFDGKVWDQWPEEIRFRRPEGLRSAQAEMSENLEREKFQQYLFFRQWNALKDHCLRKGVQLIGDIPIYVHHDSADVWSHQDIFKLDERGKPYVVSGVPPDYFSETGQLWGNPIYRWDVLRSQGYEWWLQRLQHNLTLTDLVRLDHFRGLVAYWEVSASETTAKNGKWKKVPVLDFFRQLLKRFPYLPIIAEDLGTITADVREVIHQFDLPGMKVLLFAFGDDPATNPYVPHNVVRNSVIYTGTHDNNTSRGWFDKEASDEMKERLFAYLGREVSAENIHRELTRLATMSVANLAIIPMQDVLGLGEASRMNRPAGGTGNWEWRLLPEQLTEETAAYLYKMAATYGRI
jgi:4-alpha-glucanotransferase